MQGNQWIICGQLVLTCAAQLQEVYIDKVVEVVHEILREVPVDKIVETRVEVGCAVCGVRCAVYMCACMHTASNMMWVACTTMRPCFAVLLSTQPVTVTQQLQPVSVTQQLPVTQPTSVVRRYANYKGPALSAGARHMPCSLMYTHGQVLKEIPVIRYVDKVVHREVPVVQVVEKIVETHKEVPVEVGREGGREGGAEGGSDLHLLH